MHLESHQELREAERQKHLRVISTSSAPTYRPGPDTSANATRNERHRKNRESLARPRSTVKVSSTRPLLTARVAAPRRCRLLSRTARSRARSGSYPLLLLWHRRQLGRGHNPSVQLRDEDVDDERRGEEHHDAEKPQSGGDTRREDRSRHRPRGFDHKLAAIEMPGQLVFDPPRVLGFTGADNLF